MPELVRSSKRRLDRGPNRWIHKDLVDNSSSKLLLLDENPNSHDDNGSEGENPTHPTIKKQRGYMDTNEDDYQSHEVVEPKNLKAMPELVLSSKRRTNRWMHKRDLMNSLVDNSSSKLLLEDENPNSHENNCSEVHNLSKSLSRVIEVTKQPRSKVWPKEWDRSSPTSDDIGLYLFPHKMRPDKHHEELLKEVMENDLALRAIVGDIEMLMFPSSLLPKRYQTFQMKHYLWGVFKPREVEALHQPDCTSGATAFAANATSTGIATDAAAPRPHGAAFAANAPSPKTATSAAVRIPSGATGVATDVASIPNGDTTDAPTGPNSSSMGAPPGRMLAFIVKQTPRLEELIREMQREGALVMQGEIMSTGSWPGKFATVTQHGQT
ncbi:hypothetical protein HU200_012270 [Digitaria exilis]|uniref:AIPP2-like SPOC-like domain-containing protein n=1 Tax=Digitaria exilis TaxID=1010633 RepID=A0A835KM08_9POAL|nr:hypothetical protein HU200_012270 [Digitaria exilis]